MSRDLIDTVEMYLRTVLDLIEEGVPPLRARIAERLGHTGPTVSQTIKRMRERGLVELGADRVLSLTPKGLALASSVLHKHRIAECFLVDVIGLEWAHAHDEACRLEHVMSDRVAERLGILLGHPRRSPYGNLIPSPARPHNPTEWPTSESLPLTAVIQKVADTRSVKLAWISEALQAHDGALDHLHAAGVTPGVELTLFRTDQGMRAEARLPNHEPVDARLWDYLFVTVG